MYLGCQTFQQPAYASWLATVRPTKVPNKRRTIEPFFCQQLESLYRPNTPSNDNSMLTPWAIKCFGSGQPLVSNVSNVFNAIVPSLKHLPDQIPVSPLPHLNHLRIKTYNLMRDFIPCHQDGELRWSRREGRILNNIRNADADVLCLQECIDLPNFPIADFLMKLNLLGYFHQSFFDHSKENTKPIRVVIAWKDSRFVPVVQKTLWLSPNEISPTPATAWGQKVSRPLGLIMLRFRLTGACFWIANTHVGYATQERLNSMKLLPWLLEKHTKLTVGVTAGGMHYPVILVGDFNMFYDSEAKIQLREIVTDSHPTMKFTDIGILATPKNHKVNGTTACNPRDGGDKLVNHKNGTFVGTDGDPWAPSLGSVGDAPDGIFVFACQALKEYNATNLNRVWVWNYTGYEPELKDPLNQRNVFPSDHLGLVADLLIHNQPTCLPHHIAPLKSA